MFSGHQLPTLSRLRALASVACLALALALAACGPDEPESDEPFVLDVADKAKVTIEAEFGTTKVQMAGRQELWVTRSSGWDPCPEVLGTEFQPETCWIRAYIDETLVATLLPEPNGTLGPYAIPIHFDVFEFLPGQHFLRLVQVGRLELRYTDASPLEIVLPVEETPTPAAGA
ncbi:MAG: hypothetical protein OXR64_05510 [Chloroflexota bacterium]|nr:hypothetical protein [Chloroflexota bacterium]MDE2919286.1 hypothetical protein [Chloroflexota bacterium]